MASHHFDDDELGFVDAALSVAKGIGGVFKKIGTAVKKKKAKTKAKKDAKKPGAVAKGKITQLPMTEIVGQVPPKSAESIIKTAAAKAKAKGAKITPQEIAREVALTIPPLVRSQVLEALKEANASNLSRADNIAEVTAQVDDAIKPHVTAMLASLQSQQLSRDATYEHKELVAREDFRRGTKDGLSSISQRLDELAAAHNQVVSSLKLGNIAVVRKNLPIFGPKNVLEG
jgi:hypothetical protein